MRMTGAPPGCPEFRATSTPATRPCIDCATFTTGRSVTSLAFTLPTAPVRSERFWVPSRSGPAW